MFKKRGLVDFIPWDDLNPGLLRQKTLEMLDNTAPYVRAVSEFPMTGLEMMRARVGRISTGAVMADNTTGNKTLALVLKGYPRISETFISNEIRLLEKQGFDIHIFSMRRPRENFSHASVKRIKAGVTYLPESMIRGLPALLWANVKLASRMPGRYLRGLKLMFSRFRGAPKKHTWLKHFLQGAYMVEHDIRHGGYGHVHAHFAHTPASVALYAAELAGLPFSFTAHAKDIYTQAPDRLLAKMERAPPLWSPAPGTTRIFWKPCPADGVPVHTVYHGIDLALFSMNGRGPGSRPPYSIMTVARFVEKKGTAGGPRRPENPQGPGRGFPLHPGGRRQGPQEDSVPDPKTEPG